MIYTNATIKKWGNSQGIIMPKFLLDQFGFYENEKLEIIASDEGILLKKLKSQDIYLLQKD